MECNEIYIETTFYWTVAFGTVVQSQRDVGTCCRKQSCRNENLKCTDMWWQNVIDCNKKKTGFLYRHRRFDTKRWLVKNE